MIEPFEEIAAVVSTGQFGVMLLLFWRVWRLEKKFDNGVNHNIEELKDRVQLLKENCIIQHGRKVDRG